jgi:hypothetical protein
MAKSSPGALGPWASGIGQSRHDRHGKTGMWRGSSVQSDGIALINVVVFGERHLRHLLDSYQKYYNECRTHLSLRKDAPIRRNVQTSGRVLEVPILGGLHHQYVRV